MLIFSSDYEVGGKMNKINEFCLKEVNGKYKIERIDADWDNIINDMLSYHQDIAEIILNPESLYFYATNNQDSIFLPKELTNEQLKMIKKIFDTLIKNPDKFYDNYKKEEALLNELASLKTYAELSNFIERYGLKYKCDSSKSFENEKLSIKKKIKNESCYGIFGEIIFYTIVEHLMPNRRLLLSKISFITAPGTYSHGCDGIFCDYDNKILCFGESKFTIDLSSGLEQAICSLNNLTDRLENDKNFIMFHNRDFKNIDDINVINGSNISSYEMKIIIFILHGNEFNDQDIVSVILKYNDRLKKVFSSISYEIVCFPIIDKEGLKEEISRLVSYND